MNKDVFNKKKLLAVITAFISIFIGLIYLALVFVLDFRGPMSPPPSEALTSEVAFLNFFQPQDQ